MVNDMLARSSIYVQLHGRIHGVGGRISKRNPPSSSADSVGKNTTIWELSLRERLWNESKKKKRGAVKDMADVCLKEGSKLQAGLKE